jgi:hypothetical protein
MLNRRIVASGLVAAILAAAALYSTSQPAAASGLQYVICDVKRLLSGRQGNVDEASYRKLIDAFKFKLGCNGIRVHIDAGTPASAVAEVASASKRESYTKLYRDVFAYARSNGLVIYANLLPVPKTLEFGGDAKVWGDTVSTYVNHFCPDFIGPFNENSKFGDHVTVVKTVRSRIKAQCQDPFGNTIQNIKIVGPDSTKIAAALRTLKREPGLADSLDIVTSHNNNGGRNSSKQNKSADRSESAEDWQMLQNRAGKPVWASEAASTWSSVPVKGQNQGKEVGLKAMVGSGAVSGVVLYLAASRLDTSTFELNDSGKAIVDGLKAAGWKIPTK